MDKDDRFLEMAPIAASIVKKTTGTTIGTFVTEEDLVNEAYAYGYWRKYSDWSNESFLVVIKFDMLRSLKKLSIPSPPPGWGEKLSTEPPVYRELVTKDFMEYVKRGGSLSRRERSFLDFRFVKGLNVIEIAKEWGTSRNRVYLAGKTALNKIGALIEGKNYEDRK